jgi:hypothetical protein
VTAFRLAIPALLISLLSFAHEASSRELFEEEKPPVFSIGQSIYSDDTLGNYQIYAGNGMWQFESASVSWSGGRADSIPIGVLRMTRWEGGEIIAAQTIVANIRANNGAFWSGSPCEGENLAKRNRGRGRYDDCMRIGATTITVGSTPEIFLQVDTVQSNAGGRYYAATLLINTTYLGFNGGTVADWSSATVQADPAKAQAIAKLTSWAERYQDAAAAQMDYRKPADTFAAVPKLSELRPADAAPLRNSLLAPVVQGRSASYVFCESSQSMVLEGAGDCPAIGAGGKPVARAAAKKGKSASYVFCESSKSMVLEDANNCPGTGNQKP